MGEAAKVLGVSADTLRRWDRCGKIRTLRDDHNRRRIARTEVDRVSPAPRRHETKSSLSARNRFPGIVKSIEISGVMALVEIEAGPHRITAAITRDSVEELGLRERMPATATVKATPIMVQAGRLEPPEKSPSLRRWMRRAPSPHAGLARAPWLGDPRLELADAVAQSFVLRLKGARTAACDSQIGRHQREHCAQPGQAVHHIGVADRHLLIVHGDLPSMACAAMWRSQASRVGRALNGPEKERKRRSGRNSGARLELRPVRGGAVSKLG